MLKLVRILLHWKHPPEIDLASAHVDYATARRPGQFFRLYGRCLIPGKGLLIGWSEVSWVRAKILGVD